MSSEKYVNQAVREVETELEKINQILLMKAVMWLMIRYRPKVDSTPELEDPARMRYY
jgi:hypothetical protein